MRQVFFSALFLCVIFGGILLVSFLEPRRPPAILQTQIDDYNIRARIRDHNARHTARSRVVIDQSAQELIDQRFERDYDFYNSWAANLPTAKFLIFESFKPKRETVNVDGYSGVVLTFNQDAKGNIYHQLVLSNTVFVCLSLRKTKIEVYHQAVRNPAQFWTSFIIKTICDAREIPTDLRLPDASILSVVHTTSDLTASNGFILPATPVPELEKLRSLMLAARPPRRPRYVLLLIRHSRRLVDLASGTARELVEAMGSVGLPVRVADTGLLTPAEQIDLLSGAAVLVSAHGADMTNMLWMQRNTAVLEVLLRFGWCCDPIPPENMGPFAPPCQGPCRPYHKGDFANLAGGLGLRYAYFDADYSNAPDSASPIDRKALFVNSSALALSALSLYSAVL